MSDLDDYEAVVTPATTVFERLDAAIANDLSAEHGGVGWWEGHLDWRRRVILSNYLLSSLDGVREGLTNAALEARFHREQLHADNAWLVSVWREVATRSNEDFLAASVRGKAERRRDQRIEASSEHCLVHLVQALDRVAAAMVIIGAVEQPVLRIDWKSLDKVRNSVRNHNGTPLLAPLGSPGRMWQDELFAVSADDESHGPHGWLPWLLQARHTSVHRAPKVHWQLLIGQRRRVEGLLHAFHRQPGWAEIEAMTVLEVGNVEGLKHLLFTQDSRDMLDGLVGSTVSLCAALGIAMEKCWTRRRGDPGALIQHGKQWPQVLAEPQIDFAGYGEERPVIGNLVHIGDALARRMQASRLTDRERHSWRD